MNYSLTSGLKHATRLAVIALFCIASGAQNTTAPSKTSAPEFYDEPKFTVSDVADPTALGGHGSNASAAAKQSLAKDVESIKDPSPSTAINMTDLQKALQNDPANARLRHQLAEAEERSGNPLAAVREYQRAAELDPSEQNLFDWGSELLAHGAAEPAVETFTKGHRLFPSSVRMLTGLGAAWYLRGSYEQAIDSLCNASDLEPNNETPHVFLGKILAVENVSSERVRSTLKRYASLRPENANANYLYALSLWKQPAGAQDPRLITQVESFLQRATRLAPNFAPAFLQLGIVNSDTKKFPQALVALKKAAELDPKSEQAHYRLAQAYRHLGDQENAQREMQAYRDVVRQHEDALAQEQRTKQVFVLSPRPKSSADVPK